MISGFFCKNVQAKECYILMEVLERASDVIASISFHRLKLLKVSGKKRGSNLLSFEWCSNRREYWRLDSIFSGMNQQKELTKRRNRSLDISLQATFSKHSSVLTIATEIIYNEFFMILKSCRVKKNAQAIDLYMRWTRNLQEFVKWIIWFP